MRQEPFFPHASQKELFAEMERCAMLLRVKTQEYHRALASPSAAAVTTSATASSSDNAQELYGAMVQLANQLEQVTHDLHFHQRQQRHLAKATTIAASLAPTKTIKKKKASSARRCEHCGQTSSAAWRRGPDYCQLCNVCGLQYKAKQNITRSMSVLAVLN